MNSKLLIKRMKENYGTILNTMTAEECAWAEDFERMEHEIERGKAKEAIRYAKALNPNVSQTTVNAIKEDCATKDRCNPDLAARNTRRDIKNRKTDRKSPDNMYDASDWVRQKFKVDPKTDTVYEVALATNPEDALIAALDAAAVHGVSLESFINDTKYHTPERKAGRPKKVQE